jgi:hypothetical protein
MALATLLSIPLGFGVGSIPLLVFAAGEVIAALYIPSSIAFRDKVNRQWRTRERAATRKRLLAEIDARGRSHRAFQPTLQAYQRMTTRVDSLYRRAQETPAQLALADVERLDDVTVEYLYIWMATRVMDERGDAIKPSEIEARISELDEEIARPNPGADLRQLHKARADYVAILERHHRMMSRKRALDAAMLAMPDQLEEIYQSIMTAPLTEGTGTRLDESISKLRLQEDIEAELAHDMAEELPGMRALPRRTVVPLSH